MRRLNREEVFSRHSGRFASNADFRNADCSLVITDRFKPALPAPPASWQRWAAIRRASSRAAKCRICLVRSAALFRYLGCTGAVALSEFDKAMTVAKLKGAAGRLRLRDAEWSPLLGVRSRIDAGLMVRKRGSAWLFIRWFRRVRSALLDF